jgi:hypothetical protein
MPVTGSSSMINTADEHAQALESLKASKDVPSIANDR